MLQEMEFYVEQHPEFGLGNFVNCTPSILRLYEQTGKPVNVLFGTDYVKDAYEGSEYINVVDGIVGERLFGSDYICRDNSMPDFQYVQKTAFGDITKDVGFAHIDPLWDSVYAQEAAKNTYIVIAIGSGSERPAYVNSKIGGIEYIEKIVEKHNCIFTGSANDLKRVPSLVAKCNGVCVGNIRQSIALINNAKSVIANDTGLAHIAGVLNKELHILWKDTMFTKNRNMGKKTTYYQKNEWQNICHVSF